MRGRECTPAILREGPYRFFFYSNEGDERPYVHVQRERTLAKFWLEPVALAHSQGISAPELGKLMKVVEARRELLLERWHEFFGRKA